MKTFILFLVLSVSADAHINLATVAAGTTIAVNLIDIGGTVRKIKIAGRKTGHVVKVAAKKVAGKK